MRLLVPAIFALLFGLFHVLTVVATLRATHGHGEGQGLAVVFLDFPLVMLVDVVGRIGYRTYTSVEGYIAFFSIAGTLMYAAIGYGVGALARRLVAAVNRSWRRLTPAQAQAAWRQAKRMAGRFLVADILLAVVLGLLSALTPLPLRALQEAWIGFHQPAVALANAILPQPGGVDDGVPVLFGLGFVVLFLLQPAVLGAAVGWISAVMRPRHETVST